MTGILITAGIILVLVLLVFAPINCCVKVLYEEKQLQTRLWVRFLFLKIQLLPKKDKKTRKKEKKQKPKKEQDKQEQGSFFDRVRNRIDRMFAIYEAVSDDVKSLIQYMGEKGITFRKFHLSVDFGFEDAAATGIMTGVINGSVYSALAVLDHWTPIDSLEVMIQPHFNEKPRFDSELDCIVRVDFAHIILVTTKFMRILRKLKKAELL